MSSLRSICVYCGSSRGAKPDYVAGAQKLATELVARDITLVYGGAHVGVMGAIADQVLSAGGRVVGVIPQALVDVEVAHDDLTELVVVGDMHERKALMAERSDGFIALPGGLGTLEELFEVLTWSQLDLHQKPCGLLNVAGYFDRLLGFLDHARDERFMRDAHRQLLISDSDPGGLIDRMGRYKAVKTLKVERVT
ncbi:MAG: TIGR00730 family Rossman fold protein [Gammaproteobacteria bacterium]|nr:TIGR00730 family Rossman fold protein [Gammaproteobacteria bacterium]